MFHINIPENGDLILINREFDLNLTLANLLSHYHVEHENLYFRISYNNKGELNELLINIYEKLSAIERKNILCSFYSTDLNFILSNLINLDTLYHILINREIIELIYDGNLFSVMQPIYDIQNKKLFGYEFLLRGHIDEKLIPPLKIYETAHALGLQYQLDLRARDISVTKASQLLNQNIKVFINFLPTVINHQKFCLDNTFNTASKLQVSLSNLVFEVVETENIHDLADLNKVFVVYKENGTRLAMDDVGAGYSSLNNLHKLSPDYVKIDRDLISFCDQSIEKQRIIASIVDLCKNLNILILAEGIERIEELRLCKSYGIHLGQGFLLGRPSENEVLQPYEFE